MKRMSFFDKCGRGVTRGRPKIGFLTRQPPVRRPPSPASRKRAQAGDLRLPVPAHVFRPPLRERDKATRRRQLNGESWRGAATKNHAPRSGRRPQPPSQKVVSCRAESTARLEGVRLRAKDRRARQGDATQATQRRELSRSGNEESHAEIRTQTTNSGRVVLITVARVFV